MDFNEATKICKALGDGKRLKIISMLRHGELCACNILDEFSMTQPALSHHMKLLCEAGLVHCRKEGKWCHYSVDSDKFGDFKDFITELSKTDDTNKGLQNVCACR
ncbi:MAG: ArsR/SmtB family transcription factor [Anaerovoracaceae bacterium]